MFFKFSVFLLSLLIREAYGMFGNNGVFLVNSVSMLALFTVDLLSVTYSIYTCLHKLFM